MLLRTGRPSARLAITALAWTLLLAFPHATEQQRPPIGSKPPATPQRPVAPGAPAIAKATAVVRGRITIYPDGLPLARARVILTRPDKPYAWVRITDANGRYEIGELEAFDNYMISANKTGYAARTWGEQQLPALPAPVKLTEGQALEDIDIALAPHLWISGKITDTDGTPFGGAVVSALKAVFVADRREMVPVAEIITNDKGEYRLFGLPAGQYFISAIDPAFMSVGDHQGPLEYTPTFYPGVTSAEGATRVTLEPGTPRENLDFKLLIVKPSRVSGRITSSDNQPLTTGGVIMTPIRGDGSTAITATEVDIRPDGRYDFFNVPPGRFRIRARGATESSPVLLFGLFDITVGGQDLRDADMTLTPGGLIEGLVEWEGNSPRPNTDVRIRAPMSDGSMQGDALTGKINGNDRFAIKGAMVGSHFVRIENLPAPWTLKAVYYHGQDVTDLPIPVEPGRPLDDLRVVLSDRPTRVTGTVVSSAEDDMESYRVIVFPVNQLYRRPGSRHVRLLLPDREGRFSVLGLPPGLYYFAATRELDEADLGVTTSLERLTSYAVTLQLAEGQRANAVVPAKPLRRQTGAAAERGSR